MDVELYCCYSLPLRNYIILIDFNHINETEKDMTALGYDDLTTHIEKCK